MVTNQRDDDRDAVLGRIREALRERRTGHPGYPDAGSYQRLLPEVGDPVEEFADWLRKLAGELVDCLDRSALPECFSKLAKAHGWRRPAADGSELVGEALSGWEPAEEVLEWDGSSAEALERCDVGITGCDALIGQTGSVLLSNETAGGRALSILPPHHVVIARRDQVVADLPEAMDLIEARYGSGENRPSMISLHTGPSRTGDIERILVLGAHGPKKLTVIMIEN